MRLIDADALKEKAFGGRGGLIHTADVDLMPSVDAVPVVRCKDCNKYQDNFYWCELLEEDMQPMDFCSYGERENE